MAEINHVVGIRAVPEEVYGALTRNEGISKWWTRTTNGPADVSGGVMQFDFGGGGPQFTVSDLKTNQSVKWICSKGGPEWLDTEVTFELKRDDAKNQTLVHFKHAKWREITPHLGHCTTKWGVFMLSLKDLLEKGEGNPFPNDRQINHS
jgi:uncharacterized protein YndB with AHSA1/START domain